MRVSRPSLPGHYSDLVLVALNAVCIAHGPWSDRAHVKYFRKDTPSSITERPSSVCGQSSVTCRIFYLLFRQSHALLGTAGSVVALDPAKGYTHQGFFDKDPGRVFILSTFR